MLYMAKKNSLFLFLIIIEIVLGILFLALSPSDIMNFFLKTCGILIILFNVAPCLYALGKVQEDKKYISLAISSAISITIGILILIYFDWIMNVILAVWLIVMPCIKILFASNKKMEFNKQLPYFFAAIIVAIFGFSAISSIVIKILGGIFLVLALIQIIIIIINNKKTSNNSSPSNKDVIDAEVKEL